MTLPEIPKKILKSIRLWNTILILTIIIQFYGWYLALFELGAEKEQGDIYRIIFVHVPVAWCAFFWVFFGAVFGVLTLIQQKKSAIFDRSSHTAMELGTLFSFLMLVTGSIWGRPTWGVWWDWDPRLTSSLVMCFMCCGYLILRHFTPVIKTRQNVAAIVTIINAINIPVVYFSVNLWRSLHQPQTFFEKTQNASTDVTYVLFFNYFAMFFLSIAMYKIRRQSIAAQEILESARSEA